MAETARYLYAITRGVNPCLLDGIQGLGGTRVRLVEHRELTAVVSDVSLEEFGEEALRRNLEQLEWLEKTVRVHDAVIRAVWALGPTAPLRLATICLDDDGVRRRMDEWYFALGQVLDRIEGRLELSIKVFAPLAPTEGPRTPDASSGIGGAEYLRRKKAAALSRLAAEEKALKVGETVHATLSDAAVASRVLPAQDPRLTGHIGAMLLNGAYLVEADEVSVFETRTRELRKEHPDVTLELRGPWPPYSFAMLEQR